MAKRKASRPGARGQVRIVAGLMRRTPLPVGPDREGLRPTPERARATLFDWLGEVVVGSRCLDLFCGTGALGLEALSRGAGALWLNDKHEGSLASLRDWVTRHTHSRDTRIVAAMASITLTRLDATRLLGDLIRAQRQFDLIFLDPPFQTSNQGAASLQTMIAMATQVLAQDGRLYLESGSPYGIDSANELGLTVQRHGRAGQVHYHLLARQS